VERRPQTADRRPNRSHWEQVYRTRRSDEVSWYQAEPGTSLGLIQRVAPESRAPILDVGGGTSFLVDRLLAAGYSNVSVLDISATALNQVRQRLSGDVASSVRLLEEDVLTVSLPPASIDVWHDRAVFHFLTNSADRDAYVAQVRRVLRPNGHAIVATFAEDGPQKCSGLPVARYSAAQLHAAFGNAFRMVDSVREVHATPSGAQQTFQYCACLFVP